MRSGEPFISHETVRAALESLLYTSIEKPLSPLQHLWLVDEYLTHLDIPLIQHDRSFALNAILTEMISDELQALRHNLGLSPLRQDTSADSLLSTLAADAASASPELIGWDWLYCRYVRVDLNISQTTFCSTLHLDERTLRRYQQHALKRFTEKLIQAEWAARVQQRKRRLYSEMPSFSGHNIFIGRDELLNHILNVLQTSPHVLLTGAAGVGKTALAQVLLHRQIETQAFEQLIWIGQPETVEFARHQLYERLLPEARRIRLQDYLQLYRVAIVLDGIERLDAEAFKSLLDELAAAQVILTSRQHFALPDCAHIIVPELSPADAAALFQTWLEINYPEKEDWPDEALWQEVGGNPLAISLMAQNIHIFNREALIAHSVEQLFVESYARLTPEARRAWFALALCPPGVVNIDHLLNIWPSHISRGAVAELLRKHLLEPAGFMQTSAILTSSARNFIASQNRGEAKAIIRELIGELVPTQPLAPYLYEVLEHILLAGWLEIDSEQRRNWINAIWREGLQRGRYAVWKHLFQTHSHLLNPPAQIAYAVCLRKVGEWGQAQQVLETIIFQAGRAGAFPDQAGASLELAVLLRQAGAYERATVLLARAERIARRYQDRDLLRAVEIEKAQIAVDRGDTQNALAILSLLPQSRRVRFLLGETWLLVKQAEPCRTAAHQLILETSDNPAELASAYTLLARVCEQAEDWEAARLYFSSAVTLLETQHDLFALARAQVNLGALMMHAESWDEAHYLFTAAEAIQERMNDRVALEVTRHNLRLLDARAAG
ncbi:MAG: ATP-binding protein [Chloroflexi bacterium]|nr:ATP-binding protein [Chloroflexota bacterium]MDL1882792.1 ATP-binding protein [Anaerolineae bacterium CFX8]